MYSINDLTKQIKRFRDERDWKQFHSPKNMILSLLIEAGELAEHFQWKTDHDLESLDTVERAQIGEELSDVLYWVLLIANDLGVDMDTAFKDKMLKNEAKYPVKVSKGKSQKYSEFET